MDYQQIPEDIWKHIISFLRNPIPEALSNPPRSELRQPHLCSAARVSKLFSFICNIHLYTHIATDNLSELFADISNPSAQKRFAHTRSLSVEYCDKFSDQSYTQLLDDTDARREGAWMLVGLPKGSDQDGKSIVMAKRETRASSECLLELCRLEVKEVFPLLETVAICSIYPPGQEWDLYAAKALNRNPDNDIKATHIPLCVALFERFLSISNIRSICTRDTTGPLSLPVGPPQSHSSTGATNTQYLRTVHISPKTTRIPFPLGISLRLIQDHPVSRDSRHFLNLIVPYTIPEGTGHLSATDAWDAKLLANIDIYLVTDRCSDPLVSSVMRLAQSDGALPADLDFSNLRLPIHFQRAIGNFIGGMAERSSRGQTELEHSVRGHISSETPTCACCGTAAPADELPVD